MVDANANALAVGQSVTLYAGNKAARVSGRITHLVPAGATYPRGGGAALGAILLHAAPTGAAQILAALASLKHLADGSPIPPGRAGVDMVIVELDAAGVTALTAWAGEPPHPDHALDGSCGSLGMRVGAATCACPVRAWVPASAVNP
ncbi:MAG: hypothetical protein ACYCWW_00120 [Deltaproteobacteria bacterium]